MANTATPEGSTILTATPPVVPAPETVLFPASAPPVPAPVPETPPVAPVTPPALAAVVPPVTPPPTPESKPPTEPVKPEVKPTPAPAPTDYDLKLPEGSLLTPEDLAQTLKESKEAGLTKEQAEMRLTSKDQGAKALQTRQNTAFEQTKVQWKEAVEKDPEMGGEHLAETAVLSSRAFKALASVELQVWAEKTGLGHYPEFVRMMTKIGRMMGEDKLIRGTVGAPEAPKPPEEILYGKTTPNGK
jgi:hypothetical protein